MRRSASGALVRFHRRFHRPKYERVTAATREAAVRARRRIAGACDAPTLAAIAPCASTLNGLIAGSGEAGCLVQTHRAAAEAAVEAEY